MISHEAVATQRRTSLACPEQYDGTLTDGRAFYFRYRHGWASLDLGATVDAAVWDERETGVTVGAHLDGIFESDDERNATFAALLAERLTA